MITRKKRTIDLTLTAEVKRARIQVRNMDIGLGGGYAKCSFDRPSQALYSAVVDYYTATQEHLADSLKQREQTAA